MKKPDCFVKRVLIEHDRSDPSDSLQTPEGLTNEKSMTTTREPCVTAKQPLTQVLCGSL